MKRTGAKVNVAGNPPRQNGKGVRLLSGGNPQIAKADGDAPVQAYIAALPGWKRELGERLDALIARSLPGVRKAVKWNSPFYGIEGQGWFLSLHAFTRYIKVAFFRGAALRPMPPGPSKDPDTRYIDIHEGDELDEAQLESWIRQAAALPGFLGPQSPTPGDKKSMEKSLPQAGKSASQLIDAKIKEMGDWRGEMLGKLRALIKQADPDVVEEWKWGNVPVWSHDGILTTGETYKAVVKMTFAKGASLPDPAGLFNSSLDGNTRRAIDFREGGKINEAALKALIRAAVALNQSTVASRADKRATPKKALVKRAATKKVAAKKAAVKKPVAKKASAKKAAVKKPAAKKTSASTAKSPK